MASPRFSAEATQIDLEKGENAQFDTNEIPSRSASWRSQRSRSLEFPARSYYARTERGSVSEVLIGTISSNSTASTRSRAPTDSSWRALVSNEKQYENHGEHEKKMSWLQATTVMTAETISLGILSLPVAVSSLGLLPGGLLIIGMGLLTTYTGYEVYRFKQLHFGVNSFAEAAALIAGPIGRWTVEVMQMAMLIFIMAGHVVIFKAMATTLADHRAPIGDVWFTVIAAVINIICTLPRTLKANSWLSIFSCISILAATFTAMGSIVANQGHVKSTALLVADLDVTSFAAAAAAVSNIIVSYTGHIAYFNIIEEMHKPEDFPKALVTTNAITITMYTLAGLIIYAFAGMGVKSPALESAPASAAKIAYGLAIPTIIVAGVIAALVAAKRCYNFTSHTTSSKTLRARCTWYAIVIGLWVIAWIVANVIPWFRSLLALIGAAVGTWICLGFPAIFWLWSRYKQSEGWRGAVLARLNILLVVMCVAASVLGMYGAIAEILKMAGEEAFRPFS